MRNGTWIFLSIIGALIGCGDKGLHLAPVEGTVILDGKPVAEAGIMFTPVGENAGPYASGTTNEEGVFTLRTMNEEGALVGEHRVTISKADPFGVEVDTEQLEDADFFRTKGFKIYETKDLLPSKYGDPHSSELNAKVEDSQNHFEFELSSK